MARAGRGETASDGFRIPCGLGRRRFVAGIELGGHQERGDRAFDAAHRVGVSLFAEILYQRLLCGRR